MQRLVDIAPPEIHAVWEVLSAIPDPEVPVLTITDLGMVRSVDRRGDGWVIGFTPTYSGCPATEHLLGEIRAAMTENGYAPVHIVLQLDPPWTTDWMGPEARER
ncbi:TPA: phenylacetate-CoA oxygenase subunit PaaJ, partial [Klebsiella oxytoca]|nr:phenylacetate-CoA oxygenase subunit PaaJ [Klebsiella oxytoca]HCC6481616.1 phenylacetate-CoA oxygenase subunit PaaJ [Klebsiella oxytoca]